MIYRESKTEYTNMKSKPHVVVIIPAFNEENSVGKVIHDISKNIVSEIIVVNNNSNDLTSVNAKNAGAIVLDEPIQGYGNACLKGIAYVKEFSKKPDIIVFIDADYSDYPEEIEQLISPIINDEVDMVIGSRALGNREKGSMTPQQIFGNWLATTLIKLFYKVTYTDLGPFRAIKYSKLIEIDMKDKTYGWTVEMQLKAAKHKFKTTEIPVKYRVRIGHSKVSGTLKGTIGAGYKIITTIFKYL
jgi:glycosyltransferase involved in cell wall biosynthesis